MPPTTKPTLPSAPQSPRPSWKEKYFALIQAWVPALNVHGQESSIARLYRHLENGTFLRIHIIEPHPNLRSIAASLIDKRAGCFVPGTSSKQIDELLVHVASVLHQSATRRDWEAIGLESGDEKAAPSLEEFREHVLQVLDFWGCEGESVWLREKRRNR